jgi:hypothetical protein
MTLALAILRQLFAPSCRADGANLDLALDISFDTWIGMFGRHVPIW